MRNKQLWRTLLAAVSVCGLMTAGTVLAEENVQETVIELSDEKILVNGAEISSDSSSAVYIGEQIVYYEAGHDETYGEGDAGDEHSAEEAATHTVVTITEPGTYRVSGTLSKGQIAVDLGEEAEGDASAVVNLILDNADITCEVASSIVVYNAYECGNDDTETAVKDVDTSAAGFNLVLADDSVNTITGSHVAKIYKDGTTKEQVEADEAKKKWKFDAAIDSLVSFNINGEETGNGILNVTADNEGISSALHMTINGGEINIQASDDSMNASEDYVSVITINGGTVICDSDLGAEGDGIDSNGWLVMNGGYVLAGSNPNSMDSGIDSDMGIYINGGTLLAGGNMYDEVSEDSAQPFLVMSFAQTMSQDQVLMLKNSAGEAVTAFKGVNNNQILIYSSDLLTDGDYTLSKVGTVTGVVNRNVCTDIAEYADEVLLQGAAGGMIGFGGMGFPGGMQPGKMPEGMELPEGMEPGQMPEGMGFPGGMEAGEMPEGMELPEGMEPGQMPEGMEFPEGMEQGQMPEGMELPEGADPGQMRGGRGNFSGSQESSTVFTISGIYNAFSQITEAE